MNQESGPIELPTHLTPAPIKLNKIEGLPYSKYVQSRIKYIQVAGRGRRSTNFGAAVEAYGFFKNLS